MVSGTAEKTTIRARKSVTSPRQSRDEPDRETSAPSGSPLEASSPSGPRSRRINPGLAAGSLFLPASSAGPLDSSFPGMCGNSFPGPPSLVNRANSNQPCHFRERQTDEVQGRLDPLGALDRQRQPRRLGGQVVLDRIARLQVVGIAVGPLFQLLGIFLGQTGHDGEGGHAVFEGVAPYAGLAVVGFRPGASLRIAAVAFDLCRGGHRCRFSGEVPSSKKVGEVDPRKAGNLRQAWANAPPTIPVRPLRRTWLPRLSSTSSSSRSPWTNVFVR